MDQLGFLEPQTTDCLGRDSDTLRASLIVQLVKNPPAMQETPVRFLDQEDPLDKCTHSSIWGFPGGSDGKESACNAGPGFDPWISQIP